MAEDHWFDTLNKLLTHDAPRRGVLSAVVALTFGQRLGATDAAAKNGGKGGKNKNKKKKKPKKPDPPKEPRDPDVCDTIWPGKENKHERKHCRFIRRQCPPGGSREFCILGNASNCCIADCCEEGEACCGDTCCESDRHCCGANSCCAANQSCCGDACGAPANDPVFKCCNGLLVNTAIADDHCGACSNPCGVGEICLDSNCVCDGPDCPQVCLDQNCPPGQGCVTSRGYLCNGQSSSDCQCGCGPGLNYCQSPVLGWVCQSNPC